MRIAVTLMVIVASAAFACGEGPEPSPTQVPPSATPVPATPAPNPEDISEEVLKVWFDDNTDLISAELLGFLTAEVPLAGQLSESVFRAQVEDDLTLVFSVPRRISEGLYEVPIAVETDVEIDLPFVGKRAYKVSVPFTANVDVVDRSVTEWSADLSQATVEELVPPSSRNGTLPASGTSTALFRRRNCPYQASRCLGRRLRSVGWCQRLTDFPGVR